MRVKIGKDPTASRLLGEIIYEVAHVQVAEQGLPTKAIGPGSPTSPRLMIFIWVVNMLGFIPLPLSDEKVDDRRRPSSRPSRSSPPPPRSR